MLVDQDDTPLFLGAIHRILARADTRRPRRRSGTPSQPAAGPQEAIAALAPTTVVVTDGHDWATIALPRGDDRLAVEILHEDVLPDAAAGRRPRSATPTRSTRPSAPSPAVAASPS